MRPDLQDEMIRAIRLDGNNVVIHGMTQDYTIDANIFKDHFTQYRGRPSQYFDHLDMNTYHYRLWKHNCYFLPTNWLFQPSARFNDELLFGQYQLGTSLPEEFRFQEIADEVEKKLYGHMVAPWGFHELPEDSDLPADTPYCTCGSFQSQWKYLEEFKSIIGPDYQPTCKHIGYMNKMSSYKDARNKLLAEQEKSREFKSAALFFRCPPNGMEESTITVLYTEDRSTAAITKWKIFNKGEGVPASQSWDLIDKMLGKGYVPYPGHKLPNLVNYMKSWED